LNWRQFTGFMQSIERSDLISTRYLFEIDEVLVSTLNLCPSFAIDAFMVLSWSDALMCHPDVRKWILNGTADALVVHGLIFRFICDDIQQKTLFSFIDSFTPFQLDDPLLLDFMLDPQRSQHHAVDHRTCNSITERCLSYILNRRLAHFPGIPHWASKSKRRPWLWRSRKPEGATTNILSEFRWRQKEYIGCNKKLEPFWALVLALKYLRHLLSKATRSEELIALARMWSYRYPVLVSLFPTCDTKMAGLGVERYLTRFEGKEQVRVRSPLLCIV
jgi:hypothetical protein